MRKKNSRMLAILLCLCMVFTMLPTVAFAVSADDHMESKLQQRAEGKGFRSEQFIRANSHRHKDTDVVRVIVMLRSRPVADVAQAKGISLFAENTEEVCAAQIARITEEHTDVFSEMDELNIDYDTAFEFKTLLNGFSCDVAYGDLDKIADIPGVDAVYIANHYTIPEDETPNMDESNKTTGNSQFWDTYAKGEGTVIAVLDSGLNLDHEAFQAYDDVFNYGPLTEEDIAVALHEGKYVSPKIPFAYDYADGDNDVTEPLDSLNEGHGSHVAGIASGYAVTDEGKITFSGAAPGAQLVFMKIFGDTDATTTSDVYFAALEDALLLGVDVINMSFGSHAGFTFDPTLEGELYGNIYKRLEAAGIIVCASAGNSGSMADDGNGNGSISSKGFIGPDYTDYGVVGNPSTYKGNVSVASLENASYPAYALTIGDEHYEYTDTAEADDDNRWMTVFGGEDTDYVVVKDEKGGMSLGKPEDYEIEGNDVQDKIAVVLRGDIDFETKMNNAADAGAAGCIVVNSEPGALINMKIALFTIPAVCISNNALEYLMEHTTGTVKTENEKVHVDNAEGGLISGFSSRGTTPELTLKPTITSIGGYVSSADFTTDDGYVLMSGTSMASPNMAGSFANVISYLKEKGLDRKEAVRTARDLLESSAEPVSDEDGQLYSVRTQGVGLGNAYNAITAFEKSGWIVSPVKELLDSETGAFTFEVELKNNTASPVTFDAKTVVMTDLVENLGDPENVIMANTLSTDYLYSDLKGADELGLVTVEIEEETVKVEASGTKTVKVTVTLTEAGKAYLEEKGFENGAFVEGFVQFTPQETENAVPVHATFLGYYGDWAAAPILEVNDFRDWAEADYLLGNDPVLSPYYEEGLITPYDLLDVVTDYNHAYLTTSALGQAIIPGDNLIDYVPYNENRISLSTSESDADYVYFDYLYLEPHLLRNAGLIVMTVSNADNPDEVFYESGVLNLPKDKYGQFSDGSYGWGVFTGFEWDGTDENGDYLPSGTKVTVSFEATLPEPFDDMVSEWAFDLTIDSTAPVIESAVYDSETETITVTARDNQYLAGIYLTDESGQLLDQAVFYEDAEGQTSTATFDASLYPLIGYNSLTVCAMDYATNEVAQSLLLVNTEDIGKDAFIQLASPADMNRTSTKIGETFTFPGCTDKVADNYEFIGWVSDECEDVEYMDLWTLGGIYLEGDTILVTGDMTYHALYKEGERVTFEQPRYTYLQKADYSGEWAIVGWPYEDFDGTGNYNFDPSDPYVLTAGAESNELTEYDPNGGAMVGEDSVINFESANEGLEFTFVKLDDGSYTVKNAESGKYLACISGQITEIDSGAEDAAHWLIENNEMYYGVKMSSAAEPDVVLVFDDGLYEFTIMNNSEPLFPGIYATDLYLLMLYQRAESEINDYTALYTTNVPSAEPPVIPIPFPPVTVPDNPTPPPERVHPSEAFPDLDVDGWYIEYTDYVIGKAIMNGDNGFFRPHDSITRAELATVLWNLGGNKAAGDTVSFTDVADGVWYAQAVRWAAGEGIVNGYEDGSFRPDQAVTREELATMLYRYEQKLGRGGFTGAWEYEIPFADAGKVSDWADEAVKWCAMNTVVNGKENNMFDPAGSAERCELAAMLTRYLTLEK